MSSERPYLKNVNKIKFCKRIVHLITLNDDKNVTDIGISVKSKQNKLF
jgi:hypothetical protein